MNKEEAAKNYASVTDPEAHGIDFMCEVFIAGAEWDREQMMKETVEMYPCYDEEHNLIGFSTDYEAKGAYGQLTHIIIVKED